MTREEAIKILSERYSSALFSERTALETIIPELKESEYERTRKEIVEYFKQYSGGDNVSIKFLKWIEWLENHNPSFKQISDGIKWDSGLRTGIELGKKEASKAIEAVEKIDKYIDEHLANAHDMKDSNPDKKYYCGWDDALGKIAGILQDVYSKEEHKEPENVSASTMIPSCWEEEQKDNKFAPRVLPCSAAWFEDCEEKQKEPDGIWTEEDDAKVKAMCKEGDLKPSEIAWLKELKNRIVKKEQKPTPDWMPKFLDELRTKSYLDWDEHKEMEGKVLAIIRWIAPNYFDAKQKEQKPTEDWKEKRKKECPFRRNLDNNLYGCERYADVVCACDGNCSWVVDYQKLKEIQDKKEQKPLEYLPKEKVYHIMHELSVLSLSDIIPIESEEYEKIDEITSDVRDLLDYPIEHKPAEWVDDVIRKGIKEVGLTQYQIDWLKSNVFSLKNTEHKQCIYGDTPSVERCAFCSARCDIRVREEDKQKEGSAKETKVSRVENVQYEPGYFLDGSNEDNK